MRNASVIIVGAGIGGLVAAIELARQGVKVTVLERAAQPGGKMRPADIGGLSLDTGPTVFTMRWVLDAICERAGARLDELVTLRPAETLARHWWPDGSRLDLFADTDRSADAIGQLAGAREADGFRRFSNASGDVFRTLEQSFIEATRPSLPMLIGRCGISGLPRLARIKPFATLWGELGRYFRDPRLRQLFARYATYCGSSPFAAPATLMLVAHAESRGVWLVREGMHGLATAMAGLARQQGAVLRYGAHVASLRTCGGAVEHVTLDNGETLHADAFIWNGDASALRGALRGALMHDANRGSSAHMPIEDRSLSAVTWSMTTTLPQFPLDRHNVFFSADYAAEFDDIFTHGRLPRAPTIYICAQDRPRAASADTHAALDGRERLLCLVNAPATGDLTPSNSTEIEACETGTFARLAQLGLRLAPTADTTLRRTPVDYEAMFPGTGGALYGRASHGWMASFKRPGSATSIPNLFLAGGSTHPGPGVPTSAISGRLAAQAALQGLTSAA